MSGSLTCPDRKSLLVSLWRLLELLTSGSVLTALNCVWGCGRINWRGTGWVVVELLTMGWGGGRWGCTSRWASGSGRVVAGTRSSWLKLDPEVLGAVKDEDSGR